MMELKVRNISFFLLFLQSFCNHSIIDEEKAKELLKSYVAKNKDKDTLKMLEEDDDDEEDKLDPGEKELIDQYVKEFDNHKALTSEFEVFLDITSKNPTQIIRYSNTGMIPLWSNNKFKIDKKDIPECENCGGKMRYEVQFMPALWNYINEMVSVNWNSVVIYTCEDSCQPKDCEYIEEFAFVELIDPNERQTEFAGQGAALDPFAVQEKAPKKEKIKPKKEEIDPETQAQIKEQLESLQLDLE